MYARGILFGKMVLELGDMCYAKNEKTGMSCDIDFKTKVCCPFFFANINAGNLSGFCCKGFFSGTYNAVCGRVRKNGADIGEISGKWSHTMEFKGKV